MIKSKKVRMKHSFHSILTAYSCLLFNKRAHNSEIFLIKQKCHSTQAPTGFFGSIQLKLSIASFENIWDV